MYSKKITIKSLFALFKISEISETSQTLKKFILLIGALVLITLSTFNALAFAQNNTPQKNLATQGTKGNQGTQGIQGLQAINQQGKKNQEPPLPKSSINTNNNQDAEFTPDITMGNSNQLAFNTFETPNLLQQIDTQNQQLFESKINQFLAKANQIALLIFYGLVLFAIISNAFVHIIKGASLKSFMVDFLLILLFANFWQMIIMNWQSAHQSLLNFLSSQGFEMRAQNYQDWLSLLFNYTQKVLNLIDHNLNQTLLVLAFFLPVLYLWVRWLVLYITTVLQAVVIAQLMVILFAFAPIAPHYAKKPITYTICSVIKIILLQIMALAFAELMSFYLEQRLDMAQLLITFIIIYLLVTLSQHLERLLDQVFDQQPFFTKFNILQQDLAEQLKQQFQQLHALQAAQLSHASAGQNNLGTVNIGSSNNRGSNGGSDNNSNNNANQAPAKIYQMKQERAMREGDAQNNKPIRFEGANAAGNHIGNGSGSTNYSAGNGMNSLQQIQKQVWHVKVSTEDREKSQKETQQKKFGFKK